MSSIKRGAKRIKRRLPIRYGTESPNSLGFVRDLSLRGAAISAKTIFRPPTRLILELEHNNRPIRMTGHVRWADDRSRLMQQAINGAMMNLNMGVQFNEPSQDYLAMLEELVEAFNEHRRAVRYDIIMRVTFESLDEVYEEYTNNISQGGMFIATLTPPPLNTEIEVHLFLADELEVIHVVARVVHVITRDMADQIGMNPGIGVHFSRFLGDDEAKFNRYIDYLRQQWAA